MTSREAGHADRPPPSTFRQPSTPKLHVHRSQSREAITIHFSALGKEEDEEEEELYETNISSSTSSHPLTNESQGVVTALEASEDLLFEAVGIDPATNVAVLPVSSTTITNVSGTQNTTTLDQGPTPSAQSSTASSSSAADKRQASLPGSSSTSSVSLPSKSLSFPSSDKSFLSIMKSMSSDADARERASGPPILRHRQLMKNLVKSLSTDTSQDTPMPYRLQDSIQLFKQLTQPRATVAGDSKTAPSSPLTSLESRSFASKVGEVEARIEDTKRRLSEVMSDPMQLFSKIIGDDSSGSGVHYRPKLHSSSTSELSNLASLNGHLESNNNYSIKEEEGDVEAVSASIGTAELASASETKTVRPSSSSLGLDKCSMSALAKQEAEFDDLYNDDFFSYADAQMDGEFVNDTRTRSSGGQPASQSLDTTGQEDKLETEELENTIPHKTLFALTIITYGYFVLPLPTYLGGMLFGVALGFMLAIGVVWLAGPKRPAAKTGEARYKGEPWNIAPVDLKEPVMFKGWMNEINNYDPETYHAMLTHSVFVRLEGSTLRLSKPNRNISRRASINEPKPDVTFISQKIYDLTDSKIYLVPQHLARKRVWNKKYPICVELAKQDDFMSKAEGDKSEVSEEESATKEKSETASGSMEFRKAGTAAQDTGRTSASRDNQILFLFGRTGREKEEWFQRMLHASRLKAESVKKASNMSTSRSAPVLSHSRSSSRSSLDELLSSQPRQRQSSGNTKQKPLLDYTVYMANYITPQTGSSSAASPVGSPHSSPGADKKLPNGSEKEAEPVAWVNALVGRIAWDFFRETYWTEWVSKKIQMKLSKIRLPYFMNELTLTELDMGVSTPRILQAFKPSVDYQGLWFDLEISYKGSFLMTLQTKMNLARLGKETEGFWRAGQGRTKATHILPCRQR
ncbi:testis-expressed protein 2 [Chanos chanos]|uniref:Testis-expressed protein 2 n=1 Tax=Chanos chanos TaxID=29144 RepID=A0A6J2W018_CHACN|nr:testis-expressed protein 2 [Chanos chanos]